MTVWIDPPKTTIPASLESLQLDPLVAGTLYRRGFTSRDAVLAFLRSEDIPPTPYPNIEFESIGGIEAALDRIHSAKQKNETICVWGDFDVDGQTSTALLVQALRWAGLKVVHYIPIRGRESHGLHVGSLAPFIDNEVSLVLTCDTGITAHEAVDYANSRGVDVIITDHHEYTSPLPNARAVINPKFLAQDHPLVNLAGVGVAYKLAERLLDSTERTDELLDLVALGLIADIAILQGETRSLARRGIQSLRQAKRPGLKAIADIVGVNLDSLTEETIGFTFAPRLNALGRLGDANPAVDLLLTQDHARARVLALQIEGLNAQRRLLTSQVYEAAESILRAEPDMLREPAIVLSHPGWPGGVVGIVANKLVERHHKPAILLTESQDGILRGSARSVEGLNITEAIRTQAEFLLGYGGHPMAAGLSIPMDKLPSFRRGLGKAIESQLGQAARAEPSLQIDAWLGLDQVTPGLAEAIEGMAPFGAGNPNLTLATPGVTLKAVREIGKAREHLRLNIEDEKGSVQSLLWWGGAGEKLPEEGAKFDVAWSLRSGTFRGHKQITLNLVDFRIVEELPVELKKPELDVVDFRLRGRLEDIHADALIWAEGTDIARGLPRHQLSPSDVFVVYTAPPSPSDMRRAMQIVKPKKVYVFAVAPPWDEPNAFLNRLAGLCKYALNQQSGNATLAKFSSALAASQRAVELGLQWLAASGQISITLEQDQVRLTQERTDVNPYLSAETMVALRGVLNETAAYRKYLRTVDNIKLLL